MTPHPSRYMIENYQNGGTGLETMKAPSLYAEPTYLAYHFNWIREQMNLEKEPPDYVLKDILLENGFTEYCELLFPEVKE